MKKTKLPIYIYAFWKLPDGNNIGYGISLFGVINMSIFFIGGITDIWLSIHTHQQISPLLGIMPVSMMFFPNIWMHGIGFYTLNKYGRAKQFTGRRYPSILEGIKPMFWWQFRKLLQKD